MSESSPKVVKNEPNNFTVSLMKSLGDGIGRFFS